jgi:hypothetical protein
MKAAVSPLAAGFIAGLLLAARADIGAQSRDVPSNRPAGRHNGPVNAAVYDGEDRVLSAGADGFLGIWNIRNTQAEERFQVSPYSLISIAVRPGETQAAFIESDGLGLYRISAWDYSTWQNLFILRFQDPVSFITYSGGGNFIIVSRSPQAGVLFLNPETGELLPSPENFSASVSFAATGKSERTMLSYSPIGVLSYWELESGQEIRRFAAPPSIKTPILFGNNLFFGGFDNRDLVILDAVSGNEILRDSRVPRGVLYRAAQEAAEFICLPVEGNPQIIRYGLSTAGRLEMRTRRNISSGGRPASSLVVTSVVMAGNTLLLGTADGRICSVAEDGTARAFATEEQLMIREAGASGTYLSVITGNNFLGFIPLDFNDFADQQPVFLENAEQYTHVAAEIDPLGRVPNGSFLFWQAEDSRKVPLVRNYPGNSRFFLNQVPLRVPLRSTAVLGSLALFLDSTGNITVISLDTGDVRFSFSAPGALDAVFEDSRNIVIGRSAVLGNTPFLKVDITTGETVPLAYPAAIGARVYRGESGLLYGASVTFGTDGVRTGILRLNTANPSQSTRLAEHQGEDTGFSIAESGGVLAATIGGDSAALYGAPGPAAFERSPGLPLRLINGGNRFITLDSGGSIGWYDNQTGKLLALLRFYPGEWILEHRDGRIKRGKLYQS